MRLERSVSPGSLICPKGFFFMGLILGELNNIGGNFEFQNGLPLTIKTAKNTKITA